MERDTGRRGSLKQRAGEDEGEGEAPDVGRRNERDRARKREREGTEWGGLCDGG